MWISRVVGFRSTHPGRHRFSTLMPTSIFAASSSDSSSRAVVATTDHQSVIPLAHEIDTARSAMELLAHSAL